MRTRNPQAPRRLSDEQRAELRRRIAAVPADATASDPAVIALMEYAGTLRVPHWVPVMDYRIRLGDMAGGLGSLRRLADCEDWGDDPSLPCDCEGCQRRALFGVHHTAEEYKRLGLSCERWTRA